MIDWITLVIALTTGGIGWLIRSTWEDMRAREHLVYESRRKAYLDAIEPFAQIFAGLKNPRELKKALARAGATSTRMSMMTLALIGSDEVVRAYNKMWRYAYDNDGEGSGSQLLELLCGLMLSMRKDVGNRQTSVQPLDMMSSQISDIHELGKKWNAPLARRKG